MKTLLVLLAVSLVLLGCLGNGNTDGNNVAGGNVSRVADVTNNSVSNEKKVLGVVAEKGDDVAVDYTGTTDDGKVFDTSVKVDAQKAGLPLRPSYAPLEFTVGAGQMISGFDKGVVGMKVGETKNVRMEAKDAYGEIDPKLIVEIPKDNVPPGVKVGDGLSSSNGMRGKIVEVGNTTVKLDFNHELAGKALNFKITMRKMTKAK